jgi:hypothetical protein
MGALTRETVLLLIQGKRRKMEASIPRIVIDTWSHTADPTIPPSGYQINKFGKWAGVWAGSESASGAD